MSSFFFFMSSEEYKLSKRIKDRFLKHLLDFIGPFYHKKRIPRNWIPIGGVTTHKDKGNSVLFTTDNGFLEIKIINSRIWRIRASKYTLPEEHTSWATIEPDLGINLKIKFEYGSYTIKENKNLSDKDDILVKVREVDSTIVFEKVDGTIINFETKPISWSTKNDWSSCQKVTSVEEKYVGFGEKTGELVKNGRKMVFWNTDPSCFGYKEEPLYQSDPIQISVREDGSAYGIFYDNEHYSVIKPSKKGDKIDYYTESGPICYYIITGPTLKDVSKQISAINGKIPLPPRWVLGHHQSRWSYYSEEKVRSIAKKFRERNIPCDCIHLDIDYMKGYRSFTWDHSRFPDPKGLINDLQRDGFKVITMIDPGLKIDSNWDIYNECINQNLHCKLPDESPYIGRVWPGDCIFPDFTNPLTREWWGNKFKLLTDVDVDAIWLDMAEPSIFDLRRTFPDDVLHDMNGREGNHRDAHNIYGQAFAMATRDGLEKIRANKRNFIFVRSSYAGIQRYAASWTGDNFSHFISLKQSLSMVLNMGLVGQTMVTVDVGGFVFNCYPELLIRWYQLGIFYPFIRNHSADHTIPQEPFAFDKKTEDIIRKYIELRYQLLPYFYYHMWEAAQFGLPIMRPLFMEFPKDVETYNKKWHNTQFIAGEKILIAPVLEEIKKNETSVKREIYLPQSDWVNFWTKEPIKGGQIIEVDVSLEDLPIFVKAGSAIPIGPIVPHVEKTSEHPQIVEIYPGEDIHGKAYFDDGESKDFELGEYNHLTISGTDNGKIIQLDISSDGSRDDLPTTNNTMIIKFFKKQPPKSVKVNDKTYSNDSLSSSSYWEHKEEGVLSIIIKKPEFPLAVEIIC